MKLTDIFLTLARARTPSERSSILRKAAGIGRFDQDQCRELSELASERDLSSAYVLRPLCNPVTECKYLEPLEATQQPVLTDEINAEVDEWVEGWMFATDLEFRGLRPPGPMLIHGPTGSGKTTLCGTLASRVGRVGVVAECHNMLESFLGKTGERLAEVFRAAEKAGALLVVEELDALAADRGGGGAGDLAAHENIRITVALMRMMEKARFPIVATTNRIGSIDSALLRRFEYKLEVPAMPAEIRRQIISSILGHVPPELESLELNEALPKARRMVRSMFIAEAKQKSEPAPAQ